MEFDDYDQDGASVSKPLQVLESVFSVVSLVCVDMVSEIPSH